jgi:hypothetical protein
MAAQFWWWGGRVTAIDRTAYPRLGRGTARRELQECFMPTGSEVVWARERARSASHLLALVVLLKVFGRLGYFPRLDDVPAVVVEHVRDCLGLGEGVVAEHDPERTLRGQRALVREQLRAGAVVNRVLGRFKATAMAPRRAARWGVGCARAPIAAGGPGPGRLAGSGHRFGG